MFQKSDNLLVLATFEKDNAGVNEVLAYIKTKISELDSVGKIWPKSYADIREDLEKLAADGTNYIGETVYLDICTTHEIDNEDARELSKTLHSIGTILHYQDNKEAEDLKDWVILRPEWVTKAFYRIVRNRDINLAKGKFTKDQLKSIWWKDEGDNKKYPLSILHPKWVCRPIDRKTQTFIIDIGIFHK
jgi:internalin A